MVLKMVQNSELSHFNRDLEILDGRPTRAGEAGCDTVRPAPKCH